MQFLWDQVFRHNIDGGYVLPEEEVDTVLAYPWFWSNGKCLFHKISERLGI